MAKIVFKGQEYDSLADMPAQVRHDYFKAKAGYDVFDSESGNDKSMMPTGLEQMPDEVREIYERVLGDLDSKPIETNPLDELPDTEELFRRSAPAGMQNVPSDEIVYNPSPPLIAPPPPVIESDYTMRRLVLWLALALLIGGLALALVFVK